MTDQGDDAAPDTSDAVEEAAPDTPDAVEDAGSAAAAPGEVSAGAPPGAAGETSTEPPETQRLVGCYLDATVPEERRPEVSAAVEQRIATRRGGSRAQVLSMVHDVVEQHVEIAPVEAGIALIRECGLTPLAASLIVGLNREELQDAMAEPAPDAGVAEATEGHDLDEDALAILSDDYWEPAAHEDPAPADASPDPAAPPVPLAVRPSRPERYDTWSGGPFDRGGRSIPAVAGLVALLIVAVVGLILFARGGTDPDTDLDPPRVADDGGATAPVETVPPADGSATDPADDATAPTGGGGTEPDRPSPDDGGVDVAAVDGGSPTVDEPVVAAFAVPAARDDLRWSLAADGSDLFEPTPLVVPPGGTGAVRLLIPPVFLREPGVYTLRVLAGDELVVEADFAVSAA